MDVAPGRSYVKFGPFALDLYTGELKRSGRKVLLQEQGFQILAELLDHPGELVRRADLQRKLWPNDTYVDFEQGLNNVINRLRDALDDSAEKPRYIETLRGRGYRFIGTVARKDGPVH